VTAPGTTATKDDSVRVSVSVANTGSVGSAVTVQVYCAYRDAPRLRLVRFAQTLCGFEKIELDKQQTKTATVAIGLSTLARYDARATSVDLVGKTVLGAYVVDEGNWTVAVGDCSGAGVAAGYASPLPCEQQRAEFQVARSISFCGKR
jgi:hypothetical protein